MRRKCCVRSEVADADRSHLGAAKLTRTVRLRIVQLNLADS